MTPELPILHERSVFCLVILPSKTLCKPNKILKNMFMRILVQVMTAWTLLYSLFQVEEKNLCGSLILPTASGYGYLQPPGN